MAGEPKDWNQQRHAMVRRHVAARGIRDERVLAAMARVPREHFVPQEVREDAYADGPLPIDCGQTISQPYVVAWMAELARLGPYDHVLEIGTGTGYAAAVYSELAGSVISLERHAPLAHAATDRLHSLGYAVQVHVADGEAGWAQGSPYDAIISAAAASQVPRAWRNQLAIGGRIVAPLGGPHAQELTVVTRLADLDGIPQFRTMNAGGVRFVPLLPGLGGQKVP